jgi:hypothetical protein
VRPVVIVVILPFFELLVELEFGALSVLNDVDAEGQSPEDVIDECDGRPLIADFHFTSPLDNRLDRETYFRRCWPKHRGD